MISAADKLPSVSAVKNLRRIRTFSPLRRKGRQKIRTFLLLLCVLRVFAVKILGFGFAGFQGRLIIIIYEGF
jgi:hypothetical protein